MVSIVAAVNISSIAAHWTYTGGSIYCGTKHFVDAYTNAERHDLVDTNVRVTSISPGAVKTEFSEVRYKGDQNKADAVYDGIIPLSAAGKNAVFNSDSWTQTVAASEFANLAETRADHPLQWLIASPISHDFWLIIRTQIHVLLSLAWRLP